MPLKSYISTGKSSESIETYIKRILCLNGRRKEETIHSVDAENFIKNHTFITQ